MKAQNIGIRGPEGQIETIEEILAGNGFEKASTYKGRLMDPVVIITTDDYKSGDLGRASESSMIGRKVHKWYDLPHDWHKIINLMPEDFSNRWEEGDLVVIKESARAKFRDYNWEVRCVEGLVSVRPRIMYLGGKPPTSAGEEDLREPTMEELAEALGREELEKAVRQKLYNK